MSLRRLVGFFSDTLPPSPPLPDPAGPFWISDRVAANAFTTMGLTSTSLAGVRDAPDLEAMLPSRQSLTIGQRVVDMSVAAMKYPGKNGFVGRMERDGIMLYTRPEDVSDGWPKSVWQVRNAEGLRWVFRSGQPSWIVADAVTVAAETPAWRSLGPSGESVVAILEAIGSLTAEQVRGYGRTGWGDPVPRPAYRDPSYAAFSSAATFAILLMERRAQEVDPAAGGEFYRGCYFVYEITEPHWLAALDAAGKAATAEAVRLTLDAADYESRKTPWLELVGDQSTV